MALPQFDGEPIFIAPKSGTDIIPFLSPEKDGGKAVSKYIAKPANGKLDEYLVKSSFFSLTILVSNDKNNLLESMLRTYKNTGVDNEKSDISKTSGLLDLLMDLESISPEYVVIDLNSVINKPHSCDLYHVLSHRKLTYPLFVFNCFVRELPYCEISLLDDDSSVKQIQEGKDKKTVASDRSGNSALDWLLNIAFGAVFSVFFLLALSFGSERQWPSMVVFLTMLFVFSVVFWGQSFTVIDQIGIAGKTKSEMVRLSLFYLLSLFVGLSVGAFFFEAILAKWVSFAEIRYLVLYYPLFFAFISLPMLLYFLFPRPFIKIRNRLLSSFGGANEK